MLLPTNECEIWLQHLRTIVENRQRGARKAAETRRKKTEGFTKQAVPLSTTEHQAQEDKDCFCGVCGKSYEEETEEPEVWIECELCYQWFHCRCENLTSPPSEDEQYICTKCRK